MSDHALGFLGDVLKFSFAAFVLTNIGRIYFAGENESWGWGVIVPSLAMGFLVALTNRRKRMRQ